jgi:hypothetical protein
MGYFILLFLMTYEDGTAECFEMGAHKIQTPRESPKRKNTTFRTWRKFEIKNHSLLVMGYNNDGVRR